MGGERFLKCIKCRPRPHHRWRWELKTTVLHTSTAFIFYCLWRSILSLSPYLFSEPEFLVDRYTTFSSNSQTSFHPLLLKPTFTGWPWNVSPKTYIVNLACDELVIHLGKKHQHAGFFLGTRSWASWIMKKNIFPSKKHHFAQLFWATGATWRTSLWCHLHSLWMCPTCPCAGHAGLGVLPACVAVASRKLRQNPGGAGPPGVNQ